ncbi:MAG: hypothetical protein ACLP4V_23575 [Methylocella sp.]
MSALDDATLPDHLPPTGGWLQDGSAFDRFENNQGKPNGAPGGINEN